MGHRLTLMTLIVLLCALICVYLRPIFYDAVLPLPTSRRKLLKKSTSRPLPQ